MYSDSQLRILIDVGLGFQRRRKAELEKAWQFSRQSREALDISRPDLNLKYNRILVKALFKILFNSRLSCQYYGIKTLETLIYISIDWQNLNRQ